MPKNGRPEKILLAALSVPAALLLFHYALAAFDLFPPVRLIAFIQHQGKAFATTNPEYLRLFFPQNRVPAPAPLWLNPEKKAGVRRVIMLGESAAAGYPVTDYNLARLVQIEWNIRHPDDRIEVINLAAVAVNSHVLRLMAQEAMQLDPDLVILYAGHNEVIGPFGPAAKFGAHPDSIRLIRARMALRNSRIGQALLALSEKFTGRKEMVQPEWTGLNEFKDVEIPLDDPRLQTMYRHAEINFRDIASMAKASGAACLIAIPAVNLNDWEPSGSEIATGEVDDVIADFRAGRLDAQRSADLVYRAALKIQEQEGIGAAWPLYRRACDLDTRRLRADSRLRDMMRPLASVGDRICTVDIDRWLHELNPGFYSDRAYFLEHVHLTFAGRAAAAVRIVDGMEALWKNQPLKEDPESVAGWWNQFPHRERELRARTLFNGFDEHDMWSLAWKLLRLDVFQSATGLEKRRAELASHTTYLRNQAMLNWSPDNVREAASRAADLNPDDPPVHFTAGRLLGIAGQFDLAEASFRRGFSMLPNHSEAWLHYGMMSMAKGNPSGAREALAALERFDPNARGIEDLRKAAGF